MTMNTATEVLQSSQPHVNGERLWQSLMELAQLGATVKGGVCRLALTDLDRQARDLFVRWCEEAGCTVTVDGVPYEAGIDPYNELIDRVADDNRAPVTVQ